MGKQFKYASSRGIPFVLILGDDERAHGELAIKNMKSGEQIRLPFELLKTSPQRNVQHADARSTYALESLWKDCPIIPLPEPAATAGGGAGGAGGVGGESR